MKDKAIKDAMNIIKNRIGHVYNQGYEDGLKDGKESVQIDDSTAYESGLNDAWECARNIGKTNWITLEKMGFENKDKEKNPSWDVIMEYSASEAIALINKYEKGREKKCSDCKHYVTDGNTTFCSLSKAGGCCVNKDNWTPKKMTLDEAIKHCEEVADSKCDECGAEHRQLAEWLKELRQLKGEAE